MESSPPILLEYENGAIAWSGENEILHMQRLMLGKVGCQYNYFLKFQVKFQWFSSEEVTLNSTK